RTHRGIVFCRPLRGLAYLLVRLPPVRGLTGGYILSPAARAQISGARHPRFADSPGATFCRPLRGLRSLRPVAPGSRPHRVLHSVARCAGSRIYWCDYPVRGLTGGYILSPAARASVSIGAITPGSRTHRGIVFCRPLRGLASLLVRLPPVRGLTGG